MNQNESDVANSQDTLFHQLNSVIKSPVDMVEWDRVSSSWQNQIQKAIASHTIPHYLIFPHTLDSLAQVVQLAHQNNWKIMPAGNGSKLNWGGLVKNIPLVISTAKLNSIIDYAVEDLTVTVEAGVKLADLQSFIAEKGQFLPIDPTYPDSATIGGIVATADTGSWRQRYGGVRDLVLGLSFVRSDGKIAKAGGKVVKNVAGYDLMKLFTGSYGTLGIISQVTFRLYPIPETSTTVMLSGDTDKIAQAKQIIVSSGLTPTAADLLSPSLVRSLERKEEIGIMLRFQSINDSVKQQLNQIESLAQKLNLKISLHTESDEENLWKKVKELVTIARSDSAITCKIGVLPSAAAIFFSQFDSLGIIHISSGLGRVSLEQDNAMILLKRIRDFCQNNQGFLTVLESATTIKEKFEPWGYSSNALPVMQRLKQQFDSQNILNPNRLFLI